MTARMTKMFNLFWGSCPTAQIHFACYLGAMNTSDVTERLQDYQKKATEAARNACNVTDEYVHDNVWTSVAVAALVGCVVGFFLGRGRD
jgi:hypothetical protein